MVLWDKRLLFRRYVLLDFIFITHFRGNTSFDDDHVGFSVFFVVVNIVSVSERNFGLYVLHNVTLTTDKITDREMQNTRLVSEHSSSGPEVRAAVHRSSIKTNRTTTM